MTSAQFIAKLPEPRRTEITALDALIRKTAPKLEPFVHGKFLAYGPWHYKYASGREGDWFRIGVGCNKSGISVHILAGDKNGYIVEQHKSDFPKASTGRGCLRFRKLADLDQTALKKLIRTSLKAFERM
jgi:hypothetical protein